MHTKVDKIVLISGIWNRNFHDRLWENLRNSFAKQFPNAEIVVEGLSYSPWQIGVIRRFADDILKRHDIGGTALLVGHSMGGVIATTVANKFVRTTIVGIATIFSPHEYLGGFFQKALATNNPLAPFPVITFQAYWDTMVLWGTKHKESRSHVAINTDHVYGLMRTPQHTDLIARLCRETFTKPDH